MSGTRRKVPGMALMPGTVLACQVGREVNILAPPPPEARPTRALSSFQTCSGM